MTERQQTVIVVQRYRRSVGASMINKYVQSFLLLLSLAALVPAQSSSSLPPPPPPPSPAAGTTQRPAPVAGQSAVKADEDEVIRITANLVSVPVSVINRQGQYVLDLRQQDFRVFEDGVEQEISHFETVNQPFTVILMLDMSDSTRIKLRDIQNAALAFLNQLRPEDRALVISFDKQFAMMLGAPTGDRQMLSDAILRVKSGGGTALYDAIDLTMNQQLKQIPGRKAVVILTDGVDTASVRATYDSTVRLAAEQYALIFPIQYDTPNDVAARQPDNQFGTVTYTTPSGEPLSKAYARGTRYLQSIAATSGGRFQYSDSPKNLEKSFARIAEELRRQYSVGYYPRNPNPKSGKRRLKVIVSVPNATVRARDSYVFKSDAP